MRAFLFCFLSLTFTGVTAQSATTAAARLDSLVEAYGNWRPQQSGQYWAIRSEADYQADLATLRRLRDALPPGTHLTGQQRINRDLLEHVLDDEIFQRDFGSHRFPLDSEGGFLAGVIYRFSGQRVGTEAEYERHLATLEELPAYFAAQIDAMRRGLAEGKTSPGLIVKNCGDQIRRVLEAPVEESIFVVPVKANATWAAGAAAITRRAVYPAYQQLLDFLEREYLPALPEAIGIRSITDGAAYYEQRVRFFTTDDVSPQIVFETGQREVRRIRQEMEAVIARTGFQGSFADFLHFLRTDEQFYAQSAEELLQRAAWITKRMEGLLPRYFNHLPRMPLTVEPVPAALAPNYTGGRYSPGSYGRRKAGAFWVNTYNLPSRPLYVLPALALHEGVPGHHTQMMLAAELAEQPRFRKQLYLSAFGEGWALYCEYLGKEAGIYETDYEEFGRLVYEMWRVCRLVVDPGMHYFGWSRERAVAFMAENTALSLHEVNTEIDRYIGWPGQAVSYKMGELKIRELRARAESRLGEKFDLAAFHDLVLANGAVTMATLETLVEEWMAGR
ncbi:DUF885 domain-containing protein [Neolewinella lacunae]|uniref:DUF885 domain-containing protein n=1 Tax=Neolewinella lacunae TaxID=1517758 RepID=A0A923PQ71_9BACT|nr:DUF885 domain-containing protein [Neolewinella lacunae]MBC6995403.1 DUF885 domain-containing protein [Neolewinella lacunae]MDN3633854.1 DUF885 domain-containing protein [Neolewinella lacunae]